MQLLLKKLALAYGLSTTIELLMKGSMMNEPGRYPSAKVAIIGAGFVGSTTAYTLMMSEVVSHIALIDINKEKAEGEALDLSHCTQFTSSVNIEAGSDYALVKDAAIVVLAAGIAQKPGQSRMELAATNVGIFKEIIPQITKYNKDCILFVVSNPLDVLTYVTLKVSGFDSCHVMGAGTVLDTARFRYLLGKFLCISPKDITAYILGEHGDSEFVWKSKANIAGVPLQNMYGYSDELLRTITKETRDVVYQVIGKKGATYYAIALVLAKVIKAILLDQFRVFTVSSLVHNLYGIDDVCLSLPMIVRKGGTCMSLPIELDDIEVDLLRRSAKKIKDECQKAFTL